MLLKLLSQWCSEGGSQGSSSISWKLVSLRTQPRPDESETLSWIQKLVFYNPPVVHPDLRTTVQSCGGMVPKFGCPLKSPRELLQLMIFKPNLQPIKLESLGWGRGGGHRLFIFNALQLHLNCSKNETHVCTSSNYECWINSFLERAFWNFNRHMKQQKSLWKFTFWFTRCGVGSEILHFYKFPSEAGASGLESRLLNSDAFQCGLRCPIW